MSLAHRLGDALGRLLDPFIGARVRARYAAAFGTCRACEAPLSGPSPDHVCEACHAAEVLRTVLLAALAEAEQEGGEA